MEDDPLVELARIVSGRSSFDEPKRRNAFTDTSGLSEADLARDLEAELLSDLQATFAAAEDDEAPPFYAEDTGGGTVYAPEPAGEFIEEQGYTDPAEPLEAADEFALGYYDPAPDPVEETGTPPPPRPAFGNFQLRSNRGGPAFNPSALTTNASAQPAASAPRATRTGWAATAEPEETVAPPVAGLDVQHDWGLDPENVETADPAYQESLAATDVFAVETAEAPPPAFQPRHRDHRLDSDPYGDARASRGGRRYYSVFGVLVLVALGTAGVLVLRGGGSTGGEAPLIVADTSPTRIFPDETAPTVESNAVFDTANPGGATTPPANLAAGPEPVTELPATVPADDGIGAILAPAADPAATDPAETPRLVRTVTVLTDGTIVENNTVPADGAAPPAPQTTTVAETPVTTVADPPAADPPATPAATPPVTQTPTAPATPANTTVPTAADPIAAGFYVQVSSQGTEAAAQATVGDYRARAPALLGTQPAAIQRAVLPTGTWYRVWFGPFATEAAAQAMVRSLAAVGIDSYVQRQN